MTETVTVAFCDDSTFLGVFRCMQSRWTPLCQGPQSSVSNVSHRSRITPAQRAVPKLKFAIMGFLDSIAGIMGVFAVNYIDNAAMIVLLQQAAIPISMGISKMFLGAKYTIRQVGQCFF